MRGFVIFLLTEYCLCVFSCCGNQTKTRNLVLVNDTIPYQTLGKIEKNKILIDHDVDLKGCACIMPKGITLVVNGGAIKNGTLKGNKTKLECKGVVFDKVTILGSWDVPQISTSMFTDLSYDNALKDVLALAHSKVQNTIVIEKGDYYVTAHKNADVCLTVPSNSALIVQGSIRLRPNAFPRCDIVRAKGKNIVITGKGSIVGDKKEHIGSEGEWGMGIRIHNAMNICVEGLTIRNCWGDCVYVGGNSKNVIIENCTLDNGRRQGISITKADSVVIRKCRISNVFGTKPEYAIDLEPNQGDTIGYVLIDSVDIKNCVGGILTTKGNKNKRGKNAHVDKVEVRNCTISGTNLYPIRIRRCDYATVEGCTISSNNSYPFIFASEIGNVIIENNLLSFSENAVNKIEKSKYRPLSVSKCGLYKIVMNKMIER